MKLRTFIRLGAVGVAAATAAAGSVVLTTRAVKKLENGDGTPPEIVDLKNSPAFDKILAGGQKISEMAKGKAEQSDSVFKTDFKFSAAPKPNAAPGHVVHDVTSYAEPAPATFAEPVAVPVPDPIPAPIPEPIPTPIPTPVPTPIPTPIPEPVPEVPATPAPEAAPEQKDEGYTYIPMDLPYLAGKLGKENEEYAEVIITPAEQKAQEEAELHAEEIAAEEPVAEIAEEPVVEVAEPAAEVVAEKPAVDVTPEPITAPDVTEPQPEITLPTAEPIDEHPTTEPILASAEDATTFADINPLEQGFVVGMTDIGGDALPMAGETVAPETFADIAPVEETPTPVTFGDLNSEYVETLPAVEDVVAETQDAMDAVVEEPTEAPVAEMPVAETVEPIIEAPVEVPVIEAPVAEVAAEPAVEVVTEPVAEPLPETVSGREIQIGASVVSDKANNPAILAVANTFGISAQNLVAIAADQTMVFEFLYSDMRNDATLINVFFVLPDGQATMPPETEREGVLAFARNFITANEELKKFLVG